MTRHLLVDARSLVDPNAGGVGRVAHQVLESLVRDADDVRFTFVTTGARKPSLPDAFKDRVIHVHIPLPNKIWSALCMFGLKSLDRDVSRRTGETYNAVLLPNLGFVGRLTASYALILHDLSFLIEPRWFTLRMRLWHRAVDASGQIRRASRLFAVSETTARDAERLLSIPRDRVSVFHPGIPSLDAPRTTDHGPSHFVLALNETNPRKNVSTAIAAVEALRKDPQFTDLSLIIVGADDAQSLSRAQPRGTTHDWITRLSRVDDAHLSGLYQHAAALLYPSWYEGFGLPLHEAAKFGTPCLASAHGALPETAPEGTLLIPPTKPHLWVSALRDVLTNPDLFRTSTDASIDITTIHDWTRSMTAQPS